MSSPDPNYQGRNLILCFDGTGNYFDETNTNIVRLFSQLDKTRTDSQLCYYQPGIGTYVSPTAAWSKTLTKILEVVDYAVAIYLDEHIMSGYRFLMANYTKGDKIIIFGFSRGAYTARCLAGMLHSVGLLPKSNEEQINFAYRKYTSTNTAEGRVSAQGFKQAFSISVDIEFLGVWDTVASVGLTGRHLPFTYSNTIIKTFRQAFSLDEHRVKFEPNPWHKPLSEPEHAKNDPELGTAMGAVTRVMHAVGGRFGVKSMPRNLDVGMRDETGDDVYNGGKVTDVREVWFPGVHTDVGGGSETNTAINSLSNPSLIWMVNQMLEANLGLIFRQGAFSDIPTVTLTLEPQPLIQLDRRGDGATDTTLVRESSTISKGTGTSIIDGGSAIISAQDSALVADSTAQMHDPLKKVNIKWFIWWFIELLPMRHYYQDAEGHWHKTWTIHFGRGRVIPTPNPVFHIAAKLREQMDPKYKPKATWTGNPSYVA